MIRLPALRRSAVFTALAAAPLCFGLTACQPATITVADAGTPAPSASLAAAAPGGSAAAGSAAPATPAEPAAAAAAGPEAAASSTSAAAPAAAASGSVTAAITSPVNVSGAVPAAVTCAPGRVYRAHAASAVVHGDQLSFTVTVPGYRGPGTYPSVITATVRTSSGLVTTVASVPQVPTVITGAGGSFTVSATGSAGRTFSGSLGWTCG